MTRKCSKCNKDLKDGDAHDCKLPKTMAAAGKYKKRATHANTANNDPPDD